MSSDATLDIKTILDGLGQGVLIFDSNGKLVLENLAVRTFLGTDLNMIRKNGWEAATALFNARKTNPDHMIDAVRDEALESERPVRFYIFRSGEHVPCWAATVQGDDGEVNLMITLDMPDWSAVTMILDKFRTELQDAIHSTQGHIDLITKTIDNRKPDTDADTLSKRITGFTKLITVHMHRVDRLMTMLERLEDIRIGRLRDMLRDQRRKIVLSEFLEDFVEELDEITLVDPETDSGGDHRARLTVDIPDDRLAVSAAPQYLTRILHDLIRNAIMYSMRGTPITLTITAKNSNVQFDLKDEGYGVREKESDRVFEEFQRARQPQIIAEFGYGLSVPLCKFEVEAMNGRMWFESEEGVGTTFSFMLPIWHDETINSSSDTTET